MSLTSHKQVLVRHFGGYSFSFIIVQLISFGLAIFIRRSLGPEMMGIWVALQVVLGYTTYSNIGLAQAARRQIPLFIGKGQPEKAQQIRNTAFTFTVIASVVLGLLVVAGAFIVRHAYQAIVFWSLLTIGCLSILQKVSNFCIGMHRAEKQFDFVGRFMVMSALANAVFTVALIHFFDLYGYYIAMLLSFVFNLLYMLLLGPVKFSLRWYRGEIKPLFTLGLSLVFIGFLGTFLRSLDKILISLLWSLKELGVYSIVFMVGNVVQMLPNLLSVIVSPYLFEAYGESGADSKVLKLVTVPNLIIALYVPILAGVLWILLPVLVQLALPEYVNGVNACRLGMFVVMFNLMAGQASTALIAFERHWRQVPVMIVSVVLMTISAWTLSSLEASITYVAGCMLATYIGVYAAYIILALAGKWKPELIAKHLIKVCLLSLYPLAGLLILDQIFIGQDTASLLIKTMIYLALVSPSVYYGETKYGPFHSLIKMVLAKIFPAKHGSLG